MNKFLRERERQLERIEREITGLENVLKTIEDHIASGDDVEREMMYRRQFLDQLDNYHQEEKWVKSAEFLLMEHMREVFLEEDEAIIIRPMQEKDKDDFALIKKNGYEYPEGSEVAVNEYYDSLWSATKARKSFYCAIVNKAANHMIGFLSINNLSKDLWEIGIDIEKGFRQKGIGSRALKMFTGSLNKRTERKEFQCQVEVSNTASQALMKRIGAECVGFCKFITIYGYEKSFFDIKEENASDYAKGLAKQLGIQLDGQEIYVLDYRIRQKE